LSAAGGVEFGVAGTAGSVEAVAAGVFPAGCVCAKLAAVAASTTIPTVAAPQM
jgi:hypothetical protein